MITEITIISHQLGPITKRLSTDISMRERGGRSDTSQCTDISLRGKERGLRDTSQCTDITLRERTKRQQ